MINHVLQMMNCMVDVPAALVLFLVAGYFIMRNPNKPGKVSVMLLGRVGKSSDTKDSFESCVRMIIQQSKGSGCDKYFIDKMSKFEFCKKGNIYNLKHQLKIVVCFFFDCPRKGLSCG